MMSKKLVLVLFFCLLQGCRQGSKGLSKDKIEVKSIAKKATGKGVEVPDFFLSNRLRVQTKGVILFTLKSDAASDAQELTLEDLSTGQTLFENQKIMTGLTAFQDVDLGSSFSLNGGSEITVRIYPSIPETGQKLKYGENKMRVTALGLSGKRYGEKSIQLKDFSYFGPVYSGNVSPSEVSSLDGGLNPLANGISSNGQGFLFTNPVHILTH
jgi:hypothetical protein